MICEHNQHSTPSSAIGHIYNHAQNPSFAELVFWFCRELCCVPSTAVSYPYMMDNESHATLYEFRTKKIEVTSTRVNQSKNGRRHPDGAATRGWSVVGHDGQAVLDKYAVACRTSQSGVRDRTVVIRRTCGPNNQHAHGR